MSLYLYRVIFHSFIHSWQPYYHDRFSQMFTFPAAMNNNLLPILVFVFLELCSHILIKKNDCFEAISFSFIFFYFIFCHFGETNLSPGGRIQDDGCFENEEVITTWRHYLMFRAFGHTISPLRFIFIAYYLNILEYMEGLISPHHPWQEILKDVRFEEGLVLHALLLQTSKRPPICDCFNVYVMYT